MGPDIGDAAAGLRASCEFYLLSQPSTAELPKGSTTDLNAGGPKLFLRGFHTKNQGDPGAPKGPGSPLFYLPIVLLSALDPLALAPELIYLSLHSAGDTACCRWINKAISEETKEEIRGPIA